jgi:hypothetical protein
MRITSTILAAMIAIVSTVSVAQAQKAPKAKAGKCGVGMFFDKKTKACASKM